MRKKANLEKKSRLIILGAFLLVILIGIYLSYNFLIISNKTVSWASYNRITGTVTVARANPETRWHIGGMGNPVFLWSPSDQFLATIFTDVAGNRRAEIMDTERNNSTVVPTELDIQAAQGDKAQIDRIDWYDGETILVWFTYPPDKYGETISGSFLFECASYTIWQLSYDKIALVQ